LVDIYAPGTNIYSADIKHDQVRRKDGRGGGGGGGEEGEGGGEGGGGMVDGT
jgi:hypothetical protein